MSEENHTKSMQCEKDLKRPERNTEVVAKGKRNYKRCNSQYSHKKSHASMRLYQRKRSTTCDPSRRIEEAHEFKKRILPKSVKHEYLDANFFTHGTQHMRDEVTNKRTPFRDPEHIQDNCVFGESQHATSVQQTFRECCDNYQNVIQDQIVVMNIMFRDDATRVVRRAPHFERRSDMPTFIVPHNFYTLGEYRHNCQEYDFSAHRIRLASRRIPKILGELEYYDEHLKKVNIKRVELPFIENFQAGQSEEQQEHRIESSHVPHQTFAKCTENLSDLQDISFCRTTEDRQKLRARILLDIYKYGNSELVSILLGDVTGIKRGLGVAIFANGRASSERMFSSINKNPSMKPIEDSEQATVTVMSGRLILYILAGKHLGAVFSFKRKTRFQVSPEFRQNF